MQIPQSSKEPAKRSLKIYSLYDKKAFSYLEPFFYYHQTQALRAISDLVNKKETFVGQHPDDYRLEELGEWDDLSGAFTPLPKPIFITEAAALVKSEVLNGKA